MNPHPSRICDSWLENKGRCSECMSPIEEIDFWRECYNGKHNDPADCPTWYDWCNCGGTMFEEIERLLADRKGMAEDIKTLKAQNDEMKELIFLLKEYVFCDENELTEDAKALRAELLERVKESK